MAQRFQTALERQDGGAACAELSEETASKLEKQEMKPCEKAILSPQLHPGGVATDPKVYVTSAWVEIGGGGATILDEGPDGWKIADAGCRPTTPNKPFDCELEG